MHLCSSRPAPPGPNRSDGLTNHTERQKMTEKSETPSIDKAHEWLDSVLTAVNAIPEVNDESVRRDLSRCAHLLRVAIAEERFNFVPF